MWPQHSPLLPPHFEWPVCGSPGGYLPATVEDSIIIFGLRQTFSGQLFSHGFFAFPTQKKAFEFADSHRHMCLMLFAEETSSQGQRRFAAAPATTFWLTYSKLEPSQQHWYEVIREGWPCHLYFDLEFQVADCPGWDGDLMVETLMNATQELLMALFGLSLPRQSIFELDSTTASKFSRHLIITLDRIAWRNNKHVGAFVHRVMAYIFERRHEPGFASFYVNGQSVFVDLSVYTANRNMRLLLSSKFGKDAVFASTSRYLPRGMSEEQLFYSALISNVHPHARLLELATQLAIQSINNHLLVQPMSIPPQALPSNSEANVGISPYPLLDSFILGHCKRMCPTGGQPVIHSWSTTRRDGKIWVVFDIRGHRYCAKVDREHSQNNIGYVVDLHGGTFYQTCLGCVSYKSPARPLPLELWVTFR